MCYLVLEAGAFRRNVLLRTCDLSFVPESHDIQAWVELMEHDVVPDPGKATVSEPELECYRGRFASTAQLDACVGNCLYFLKVIGVEVISVQKVKACINCSVASLVPRVFVHE